MFADTPFGASAYARVAAKTAVIDASPQRLFLVMFEASRAAVVQARLNLRAGRMADKGVAVSKAVTIIGGGLKAGVDLDNGGVLARRLTGHYDAMIAHLTTANRTNDEGLLDEVDRMLQALEKAWRRAVQHP